MANISIDYKEKVDAIERQIDENAVDGLYSFNRFYVLRSFFDNFQFENHGKLIHYREDLENSLDIIEKILSLIKDKDIANKININLASNYQKKLDEMGPVEGFGDNMLEISRVIGSIKGMVLAISDARVELTSYRENTKSLITRIDNLENRINQINSVLNRTYIDMKSKFENSNESDFAKYWNNNKPYISF